MGCTIVLASVVGCTSPDLSPVTTDAPGDADDEAGTSDGDAATPPDLDAVPPDAPDPHGPDGEVPACGDTDRRDIDAVIGDQLAAFATDDYDRALELASQDFRAAIDAEGLASIIEEGYPVASDAASHETGACVQPTSGTAEVLVRVTARDGVRGELVYRLAAEAEGWRIAGAVQVGDGDDGETVLTAGTSVGDAPAVRIRTG